MFAFGKEVFYMSKKKKAAQRTPLQKMLRSLYIILVALSLVVVVSFVALKLFAPPPETSDQVELPLNTENLPEPEPSANAGDVVDINKPETLTLNRKKGVYTCLLMGVADVGGSDTIMLGVFDTEGRTASLISVPRDTVVQYNGSNIKISAAYSYGGAEAVCQSVSDMLAVPIDYYVTVNTRAFRAIVDEIGGVYFDVPVDMNYDDPVGNLHIHIKKGYQLLNGKQAEGVVRCRNCYIDADIGRTATQRAFLVALVKQTVTLSNVTKVTSLINILNTYVKSNMTLNNMVYFGTQAVGMDLDTALNTGILEGIWVSPYWELDDDSVLEVVNSLGIYEEQIPASVLRIVHR